MSEVIGPILLGIAASKGIASVYLSLLGICVVRYLCWHSISFGGGSHVTPSKKSVSLSRDAQPEFSRRFSVHLPSTKSQEVRESLSKCAGISVLFGCVVFLVSNELPLAKEQSEKTKPKTQEEVARQINAMQQSEKFMKIGSVRKELSADGLQFLKDVVGIEEKELQGIRLVLVPRTYMDAISVAFSGRQMMRAGVIRRKSKEIRNQYFESQMFLREELRSAYDQYEQMVYGNNDRAILMLHAPQRPLDLHDKIIREATLLHELTHYKQNSRKSTFGKDIEAYYNHRLEQAAYTNQLRFLAWKGFELGDVFDLFNLKLNLQLMPYQRRGFNIRTYYNKLWKDKVIPWMRRYHQRAGVRYQRIQRNDRPCELLVNTGGDFTQTKSTVSGSPSATGDRIAFHTNPEGAVHLLSAPYNYQSTELVGK